MKFNKYNISSGIKRSLEEAGFKKPTDIQFKSIPQILSGQDILAIAQTGTGKTAAFAIPLISMLERSKPHLDKPTIKAVVMVPTRELAIQIEQVFLNLGKYTSIIPLAVIGGVEIEPQLKKLNKADVLIATPGRIMDLVFKGHLYLKQIDFLVLDEADRMLEQGFYNDIKKLITLLPKRRQTMFFSATINDTIKDLAYALVNKPVRIQLSPKDPVSKNVDHAVAYVGMDDKRFFLERLIKENQGKKIIVFVRTKIRAERVAKAMERVNIHTETIHGDKDQKNRFQVLDNFRDGKNQILIATDISARGLDVKGVDFVVNYDLPEVPENYVHRIGRTGRGTSRGRAVSFCSEEEKAYLDAIQEYIGKPIDVMEINKGAYEETIVFSQANPYDWKSLMNEARQDNNGKRKKK
ncbi:DEAD/DEAH box helicase domain protein [Pseudopedobacter saltans DSM 12145]|uniref:DEAD/DEAH box helicase domain protein n=1 Tax=Pseudopedobacter saltans (strain ATCC 51119 / DSM 12145 / JCM 21818 / CCUG 39354 / LMG 10337 / NBRC 100064 / NCIMB 13643) TaxID=762903 RepID=F0SDP1_PSESL|nr:DEAD/DEAH box helicase [Pseudopedobacter saltans]ADY50768.1 DEAD/DEAH box helicase domain protein [Pseudopedobacter saltans DSM 12145]